MEKVENCKFLFSLSELKTKRDKKFTLISKKYINGFTFVHRVSIAERQLKILNDNTKKP